MANLTIEGQVIFTESGLPIPGVKVELWDAGGTYGWIASTNANPAGKFRFLISDSMTSPAVPIASLILDSTITPEYIVYKDGVQLTDQTNADYTDTVEISIDESDFDSNITDNIPDNSPVSYIQVQGNIADVNGQPAEGITINVYESGYQTKFLLASTQLSTADKGNYLININTRNISNTPVLAKRSIRVEAADSDGDIIASSSDIFGWQNGVTVNLVTNTVNTHSVFKLLTTKIGTIVSGDLSVSSFEIGDISMGEIHGFMRAWVDSADTASAVNYISGALGETVNTINNVMNAYQATTDTAIDNPDFFFALGSALGTDSLSLNNVTEDQIRDTISAAISSNIIDSTFEDSDIDSFVTSAKSYQVATTLAIGIAGETYTINDTLSAVFSSDTDVSNFLAVSNNEYDEISDFWDAYTTAYGSDMTALAQTGLQIATITGFQPQMISELMSTLGTDDISQLATWEDSDWETFIAGVCSSNTLLCVPASIRGSETDPGNTDIQTQYAQKIAGIVQNMYPLTNIAAQLSADDGDQIISDDTKRSQVATFIGNNPAFDLRINSIYDINGDDYDLTDITIDTSDLAAALAPFQRVLRVVGGSPYAVTTLIKDGIDSALAIIRMGQDQFLANYGDALAATSSERTSEGKFKHHTNYLTQSLAAMTTLTNAGITHHYSNHVMVDAIQSNKHTPNVLNNFPATPVPSSPLPNLETLFGSLDYCNCSACTSMYSPSAYLADLLNFISSQATSSSGALAGNGLTDVYNEFVNRRADIPYIDLTCKNSNTPMPYIDLVNELLELMILRNVGVLSPPTANFSLQTNGTDTEIAAYPEHTMRDPLDNQYVDFTGYSYVYDEVLSNGNYPHNLPFSLPIEETRTYLQYLGMSRYDMMCLFQAPSLQSDYDTTDTDKITNYALFSEWLGISQHAADIITMNSGYDTPWVFYGIQAATLPSVTPPQAGIQDPEDTSTMIVGSWYNILADRIDILLHQAAITYTELLQFLDTDFLNSGGNVSINAVSSPVTPVGSCQLNLLQLEFAGGVTAEAFFEKFYRFIRLYRSGKLSIYQWDILFRSLGITDLDQDDYQVLGRVLLVANKLSIAPEILACWWNDIDTVSYTDYTSDTLDALPSVYTSIFSNRGVINDPDSNNALFKDPTSLPVYQGNTAQVAGFCRITEDEVIQLLNFLAIDYPGSPATDITLTQLSRIYVLTQISRNLGYSVQDFITMLSLSDGISDMSAFKTNLSITVTCDSLNELGNTLDLSDAITASGFSISEFNYLIGNVDQQELFVPSAKAIELFLEGLRTELQKYQPYSFTDSPADDIDLLNQLTNAVYQNFSKEFKVPSQWIESMLNPTGVIEDSIVADLIDQKFITSSFDLSISTLSYIDGNYYSGASPYTVPSGSFPAVPSTDYPDGIPLPDNQMSEFYGLYLLITKIVYVANKLQLRNADFEYLYTNPGNAGFDFTHLQGDFDDSFGLVANTSTVADLNGLLRLCRWMDVCSRLALSDGILGSLIDAACGIVPALPGDDPNPPISITDIDYAENIQICYANWQDIVNQSNWGTLLTDLIGDPATIDGLTSNGTLSVVFSADFSSVDSSYSDFTPSDYNKISFILNLLQVIIWCRHTGLGAQSLKNVLLADPDLVDSHKILLAAKGKQSDDVWQSIAKPLRDTLRKKQRDALVGYVLANPASGNQYLWQDADDLYAYLLIDVQMEPVMLTSRIKQAISSVQLFIDRIIMNLEYAGGNPTSPLSVSSNFVNQWQQWRQWYSIWEANREIFLYPENWLEPDLRDDKSIFFQEFQTELLQAEVTEDSVEEAMINYLSKVQDVGRMEPVGTCDETDPITGQTITHAFARTHSDPHHYYYRKLIADLWSPWEEVDLNIKGEHIVPMVWNNKLMLVWLTFKEKRVKISSTDVDEAWHTDQSKWAEWFHNGQKEINMSNPASNETDPALYYTQLEITINWSEYKDGKWLKQKSGKDLMLIKLSPYLEAVLPNNQYGYMPSMHLIYNGGSTTNFYNRISNNKELTVPQIATSRMYVYPYIPTDGNTFTPDVPNDVDDLYIMIYCPVNPYVTDEYAQYLHAFRFADAHSDPEVVRNNMFIWNIPAPTNTAFFNRKLIECKATPTPLQSNYPLVVDNAYTSTTTIGQYPWYDYRTQTFYPDKDITSSTGYTIRRRSTGSKILSDTPFGFFELVAKSNFGSNPLENQFFFADDQNTFFVRKIAVPITGYSLGNALYAANGYYNAVELEPFGGHYRPHAVAGPPPSKPNTSFTNGSNKLVAAQEYNYYYYFQTFYHPQISTFVQTLNKNGIDGLLNIGMQSVTDTMAFQTNYQPTGLVYNHTNNTSYPDNTVDFAYGGAYSIYNWEIFFHIPMLIAQQLSANQQFAEAQKWFHYIFDPTSNTDASGSLSIDVNRFWKFKPFYDLAANPIGSLEELMNQVSDNNIDAITQINTWQQNPFDPFAIARLRIAAFMKNIVMKYIDNLIAWADQLFTQDTIESINQATQLYVLASNILGDAPQEVQQRQQPAPQSFHDLSGTLDAFSNALIEVETNINAQAAISKMVVTNTPFTYGFSGKTAMHGTSAQGLSNVSLASAATSQLSTRSSFAQPLNEAVAQISPVPFASSNAKAIAPSNFSRIGVNTSTPAIAGRATILPPNSSALGFSGVPTPVDTPMFYFCLPDNDQLLGYWDTVADRLFKIRNSLNIAGQAQQLPLFDPPINPALLVRAAAAGIDISSVLNDISGANLPHYRFTYMLQKANELCSDVKALGAALLSALEKQDAEQLALLRNSLEYNVLQSMLLVKQAQLDEANASLDAVTQTQDITQARIAYYSSRPYTNAKEQEYFNSLQKGLVLQKVQGEISTLASSMSLLPQINLQAPFSMGFSFGGNHIADALNAISAYLSMKVALNTASGNMSNVLGGYDRRQDDWQFQAQSAKLDLIQNQKQQLIAQIRVEIAQYELDNQQMQIDNNRSVDDFLRNKYTNADLYNWMITQISTTYFQAYQLAYQLARKAGSCYDFELPYANQSSDEFIQFGYWDSLKKGLLAGEQLQFDLRKLESAYIDNNFRELELTKHISLVLLDPQKLIILRETGTCSIDIPSWVFNLDFPGHYMRRIKTISISIPCVAGPYTTIACELSLGTNKVYDEHHVVVSSSNFGGIIATSSAQNDSGLFELNFHDERYLPFEGYGAESNWTLTLMDDIELRQFDYNTISDVIMHIKYTAQDAGPISQKASDSKTYIKSALASTSTPMPRYFSLRHDFCNAWYAGFSTLTDIVDSSPAELLARKFDFSLTSDQFPVFTKGRTITLQQITLYVAPASFYPSPTPTYQAYVLDDTGSAIGDSDSPPLSLSGTAGTPSALEYLAAVTLGMTYTIDNSNPFRNFSIGLYQLVSGDDAQVNEADIADVYFVVDYTISD